MNIPRHCFSLENRLSFRDLREAGDVFKEHIEEQRQIKGLRAIIVAVAKAYETG